MINTECAKHLHPSTFILCEFHKGNKRLYTNPDYMSQIKTNEMFPS